jgi:hypothetical protein
MGMGRHRGLRRIRRSQRVFQMKNDKIARFHPQGWRFATRRIGKAVERAVVRARHIASREFRFEHPVLAAQIFRLRNHAPNCRARTDRLARWLRTCWLRLEGRAPRHEEEDENRYPSKFEHVEAAIAWLSAFARHGGHNFSSFHQED